MDPNLAKVASQAVKNGTLKVAIKHLKPIMWFLVSMSIISFIGLYIINKNNPVALQIGFWLWFFMTFTITGSGVYAFVLDARIAQMEQTHKKKK